MVDGTELTVDPVGESSRGVEAAVVLDHEMQVLGRSPAEELGELVGPGLRAGGDDDVGAGVEVGAYHALSDSAGATRDDDRVSGQAGRNCVTGHDCSWC